MFDWDGSSLGRGEGGPLFVARARQGAGRHDAPAKYGAWYCARQAVSAIAESIQSLRGHFLSDSDFLRIGGTTRSFVTLRLNESLRLVDLDDPSELVVRRIRPSQVATLRRAVTQAVATSVFEEGADGLQWWSTLEADWTNVTLFYERALPLASIVGPPKKLSIRLPEVQEGAERLGIRVR